MSRHLVPALPGLEIVVGWDPPMQSFYAQVWDRRVDPDDPAAELAWVGCSPREIQEPERVVEIVGHWASRIPDGMVPALAEDKKENRRG